MTGPPRESNVEVDLATHGYPEVSKEARRIGPVAVGPDAHTKERSWTRLHPLIDPDPEACQSRGSGGTVE